MLPEDKYYERLAIETLLIRDAEPNFSPPEGSGGYGWSRECREKKSRREVQ